MKIGIIGFGFVGKALAFGLLDDVKILKVDPKLDTSLNDLKIFEPDATFICLPTPMHNDGSQNTEIIKDTLKEIKKLEVKGLIIIKSTVHPGNIDQIQTIYPELIYNPEFLREKHANEDFINSDLIVFGGKKDLSIALSKIYLKHTKCINKDHIFTDVLTASLIKYTINSFLATKVIFFNEINSLFQATNTKESWDNFIEFISRDQRIGSSHMMVPGHDGRYGFGGACFPKDITAIVNYAKTLNVDLSILKDVINSNNQIRAKYNTLTNRELEQNIKYNIKKEE